MLPVFHLEIMPHMENGKGMTMKTIWLLSISYITFLNERVAQSASQTDAHVQTAELCSLWCCVTTMFNRRWWIQSVFPKVHVYAKQEVRNHIENTKVTASRFNRRPSNCTVWISIFQIKNHFPSSSLQLWDCKLYIKPANEIFIKI